jgi:dihydrodiol dehydrogenase / D-xylose 1-dehydrogenase (NADP)
MACLREGKTESATMPLDESLSIAETMDKVRALIGLRYPMEG